MRPQKRLNVRGMRMRGLTSINTFCKTRGRAAFSRHEHTISTAHIINRHLENEEKTGALLQTHIVRLNVDLQQTGLVERRIEQSEKRLSEQEGGGA